MDRGRPGGSRRAFDGGKSRGMEREVDEGINLLLYEVDESYNDSVVYIKKPKYMTKLVDSTSDQNLIYRLRNHIRKRPPRLPARKKDAKDIKGKTDTVNGSQI